MLLPRPATNERLGRSAIRVLLALGLVAVVGVGIVWWRSESMLAQDFSVATSELGLRAKGGNDLDESVDPRDVPHAAHDRAAQDSVERGRHLATVVAQCHFCHGPDLSGREIADDPWIGRLYASNLSAGEGGVGQRYARVDWVRAIRFGVDRQGRSLLLMPSAHLSSMSDADLAALIDYLQQIPAVDATHPQTRVGWLSRLALAAGAAPDLLSAGLVDRDRPPPVSAAPERSPDYGRYLVDLGSCRVCHHADLSGGLHPLALPGEPPPPDLRPGGALEGWSLSDFRRAMRDGVTPSQRALDRAFMPWPAFAGLSDLELEAIWLYLESLEQAPPTELQLTRNERDR